MASRRITRDQPERTGPIRNSISPLRPESSSATPGPATAFGAVIDEGIATAFRMAGDAGATMQGAVERGVDTAYTVIEDYMRRGQQAAGRYRDRTQGERTMNGDNYSNGYGPNAYGPMGAMMAPWMQAMRMWTETMSAFIPGGAAMGTEWMNAFTPPMSGAQPQSGVAVRVASGTPAEVSIDLDPRAYCVPLKAAPLVHATSPGTAPALVAVDLQYVDNRCRVTITVPNDQPTGLYSGAILDNAGLQRGMLRVILDGPPSQTKV
jgi:hypothetical protein